MNFSESVLSALAALKAHKSRSLLTILGIVIGVFSVVTLVALVQGVKNYVVDQFNTIGSNLILVAPGRFSFNSDPAIAFTNNKLTVKDSDDINKYASEYVLAATPNIRLSKTTEYKEKRYLASIIGTNERFLEITNFEIEKGTSFSRGDVSSHAKVVVIGPQVAKSLFDKDNPIGKNIKIADVNFKVIGVAAPKGLDADERVIAPYTSLQRAFELDTISGISIKARENVNIDDAMFKVKTVLLQNHKKDEFSVISQRDILESFQSILGVLQIGLGAIAGISLLVGGIGIMNIMLVSVNERISEIGLRKALGATKRNIATQFILESSILSVMGGILGVLLGFAATMALKSFLRAEVQLWPVLLSLGFSIMVGVGFGTYPAVEASKKDPVESLRFEL